jgi:putative DNA primase/helicase
MPLKSVSVDVKAELDEMAAEMADTLEGGRNDTLNRLAFRAGQLVADGEIEKSNCRSLIQAAVSTGLSAEEVRRTFNSGFGAGLAASVTASPSTANKKQKGADEVIVQCASDVDVKPIDWLWPGWLPKGKLIILAGQAGTGKTTLALSLAATITAGGQFPDGFTCAPGNILMWSGEDAPDDTLVPRLKASGAELERAYFIQGAVIGGSRRPFDPATDILKLEAEAQRLGEVSLLIIDPVVNAVSGDINKANEVRRGLQPLVDFGERNNCAVLGVSHFKKGSAGSHALERVIGSQAFGALARMVLVAAQKEGQEKRVLARAKCNIAPDHGGFEYAIQQATIEGMETTYAAWGNPIEGTAREIFGDVEEEAGGALDEAVSFLRELLAHGEVPQKDIESDAESQGHSSRTLRRAKKELKVKSRKDGKTGSWLWALPDSET